MKPSDLRIVILDDHGIVLEALELTLISAGFNVVGTARTPREALTACIKRKANVLLSDLLMPEGNGVEVANRVRQELPDCKIIILTGDRSPWHLARAKQAGLDGYLSKNVPVDQLVTTILDVAQGRQVFDTSLLSEATSVHNRRKAKPEISTEEDPITPLSDQETRVLKLIAAGLSNAEIAALLNLSPHTIKAHVRHIFNKLDVSDRTSAAIWAVRSGKVSIDETSPSLPLAGS